MDESLFAKNRSYRRFFSEKTVDRASVSSMVEAARLSASAGNKQRLRFFAVTGKAGCDAVFSSLSFAAYFGGWKPDETERPSAYLVLYTEEEPDANLMIDVGVAAQSILLRAVSLQFGGCMFRSFAPATVKSLLPSSATPLLVIALGVPTESVDIVPVTDGNIRYYRTSDGTHHVPKYALSDLLTFDKD